MAGIFSALREIFRGVKKNKPKNKRPERKQSEAEQRLREAERIANMGNWEFNFKTEEFTGSEQVYRLVGLDPDEQYEYGLEEGLQFIHPDDREEVLHSMNTAFEELQPYDLEIRLLRPDNEIIHAHLKAEVMTDNSGEAEKIIGDLHDITDIKQREKELEESRQQFKSLFDHNPNAVYSFDTEGKFVMANDALEELTGYSIEELKEMNFKPLTHLEDREMVWSHFEKAAAGEAQTYQARGVHKNGDTIYVMITNLPVYVNDEIVGIFGIAQDITEQKKLEKRIKANERRWQHLVEDNPQPVQVTVDGEIVFINQAGARLYETEDPDNVIGRSVFEFTPEERKELLRQRKNKIESEEEVEFSFETEIKTVHGEKKYVEINSIPIQYRGGEAIQTVLHDITKRKGKEKIIKKALSEKEILLQEIHHRVKNNMAVVSGMLQLQAMNVEDDRLKELLEESQLRILSMAMIHEKLYQTETLSDIKFDSYLRELTETIRKTVEVSDKSIEINYNLNDISLSINQAIPGALILNELVVNCFKHAFKDRSKGTICIDLDEDNSQIELTVCDDGVGLPDDFEIERQTSLGMSLINTLVTQLNGELTLHHEKEGCEFKISFERATDARQPEDSIVTGLR